MRGVVQSFGFSYKVPRPLIDGSPPPLPQWRFETALCALFVEGKRPSTVLTVIAFSPYNLIASAMWVVPSTRSGLGLWF